MITKNMDNLVHLGARAVGDLKETKDSMAIANMTILSFDAPTKNGTIYTKDSFLRTYDIPSTEYIVNGSSSDINDIMTPEEFAEKMKEISMIKGIDGDIDKEDAHRLADDLMMKLLNTLGYTEGVEIFDNMNKYYS